MKLPKEMIEMIKFQMNKPKLFKGIIACVEKITDECNIEIDRDGVRFNTLDKSHITFISIDMKPELFDPYIVETPTKVCLDIYELNNVMRRCKSTDILICELNENSIRLTFEGDSTRQFNIKYIDNEYETPVPPSFDYSEKITVPCSMILDFIMDMKLNSDVLTFRIDKDYFIANAEGQYGESETKYLHGASISGDVKSKFSIPKLEEILKPASKIMDSCELGLGADMPLKLNLETEKGLTTLSYLLAPRLDVEE